MRRKSALKLALGLAVACVIASSPSLFAAAPAAPAAASTVPSEWPTAAPAPAASAPAPTASAAAPAAAAAAAPAAPANEFVGETPKMRGLGVGTHFVRGPNWDVDKILPLMKQMGVSVVRDGPEWASIEKTKGVYKMPANEQRWYDAVTKAGMKVFLPLCRKNTLYENPLDPDAYAKWAAWMAKTWPAPNVCAYEIWNEPPNFDFPQQYKGGPAAWLPKYCEMVQKAAAAIRQVDKTTPILENVEGREWTDAMQKFPECFKQLDGIDMHPYPKRNPPDRLDLVGPAVTSPKQYLGRELQMWVGEWGYPTMKDTPGAHWMGVTEEMQAAYQVRGLLLGIQAGAKAWCIYDMVDEGTSPTDNEDNMGLIHNIALKHAPKPAFYSLQRVARLMGPDWQTVPDAQRGKLDVAITEGGGRPPTGPMTTWFRGVGGACVVYVWKAGTYTKDAPVMGKIQWAGAPAVTSVEAKDLVTGQIVKVGMSRQGTELTLTDVPVSSNPVAIQLKVGAAGAR